MGVGSENIICYDIIPVRYMLKYNKPCLCGSLQHRRPSHPDCLINDQYNDSVVL